MQVAIETYGSISTVGVPANIPLSVPQGVRALVLLHSQVDDAGGANCIATWNGTEDFIELVDFETVWGRADVYVMYLNNPTPGDFNVAVSRQGGRGHAVCWALTGCAVFPGAMIDLATAEINSTSINASPVVSGAGDMVLGGGAGYGTNLNAPVGGCVEDVDTAAIDGRFWAGHEFAGDNIGFSSIDSVARGCIAFVVRFGLASAFDRNHIRPRSRGLVGVPISELKALTP